MEHVHPTYLSLVIATCRDAEDCAAPTIVVGFGMFSIDKLDRDNWRFKLNAAAIDTLDDEKSLLISLADSLPMPQFLVSEHIEKGLFVPLLQAANRIPPPAGAHLGMRVARLRRALPVDVSLGVTRRRKPLPFADPAPTTPPIMIKVNEGKVVDTDALRARLEARAVHNWLAFLGRTGMQRPSISQVATATWMASAGWKV